MKEGYPLVKRPPRQIVQSALPSQFVEAPPWRHGGTTADIEADAPETRIWDPPSCGRILKTDRCIPWSARSRASPSNRPAPFGGEDGFNVHRADLTRQAREGSERDVRSTMRVVRQCEAPRACTPDVPFPYPASANNRRKDPSTLGIILPRRGRSACRKTGGRFFVTPQTQFRILD